MVCIDSTVSAAVSLPCNDKTIRAFNAVYTHPGLTTSSVALQTEEYIRGIEFLYTYYFRLQSARLLLGMEYFLCVVLLVLLK